MKRSQHSVCYQALWAPGAPCHCKVLGDSTEDTLELSISPPHHCLMAAVRSKKQELPHTSALCGAECTASQNTESPRPSCVVVNTEGTWAGHEQHPLHCLSSCSPHTEARGSFSRCICDSGISLFNEKGYVDDAEPCLFLLMEVTVLSGTESSDPGHLCHTFCWWPKL